MTDSSVKTSSFHLHDPLAQDEFVYEITIQRTAFSNAYLETLDQISGADINQDRAPVQIRVFLDNPHLKPPSEEAYENNPDGLKQAQQQYGQALEARQKRLAPFAEMERLDTIEHQGFVSYDKQEGLLTIRQPNLTATLNALDALIELGYLETEWGIRIGGGLRNIDDNAIFVPGEYDNRLPYPEPPYRSPIENPTLETIGAALDVLRNEHTPDTIDLTHQLIRLHELTMADEPQRIRQGAFGRADMDGWLEEAGTPLTAEMFPSQAERETIATDDDRLALEGQMHDYIGQLLRASDQLLEEAWNPELAELVQTQLAQIQAALALIPEIAAVERPGNQPNYAINENLTRYTEIVTERIGQLAERAALVERITEQDMAITRATADDAHMERPQALAIRTAINEAGAGDNLPEYIILALGVIEGRLHDAMLPQLQQLHATILEQRTAQQAETIGVTPIYLEQTAQTLEQMAAIFENHDQGAGLATEAHRTLEATALQHELNQYTHDGPTTVETADRLRGALGEERREELNALLGDFHIAHPDHPEIQVNAMDVLDIDARRMRTGLNTHLVLHATPDANAPEWVQEHGVAQFEEALAARLRETHGLQHVTHQGMERIDLTWNELDDLTQQAPHIQTAVQRLGRMQEQLEALTAENFLENPLIAAHAFNMINQHIRLYGGIPEVEAALQPLETQFNELRTGACTHLEAQINALHSTALETNLATVRDQLIHPPYDGIEGAMTDMVAIQDAANQRIEQARLLAHQVRTLSRELLPPGHDMHTRLSHLYVTAHEIQGGANDQLAELDAATRIALANDGIADLGEHFSTARGLGGRLRQTHEQLADILENDFMLQHPQFPDIVVPALAVLEIHAHRTFGGRHDNVRIDVTPLTPELAWAVEAFATTMQNRTAGHEAPDPELRQHRDGSGHMTMPMDQYRECVLENPVQQNQDVSAADAAVEVEAAAQEVDNIAQAR